MWTNALAIGLLVAALLNIVASVMYRNWSPVLILESNAGRALVLFYCVLSVVLAGLYLPGWTRSPWFVIVGQIVWQLYTAVAKRVSVRR